MVRRSCRLVVQLLHQEAIPRLVVKVQLVRVPHTLAPSGFANRPLRFSITTSAFSCAIAISALVTFFALQQQGFEIDWSGNSRPFDGCDGSGCALHPVPAGANFGPGPGEF